MNATLDAVYARYYRGKTILVTGGAGFIGSHLVDRLVSYGAHVRVLDNLSTGRIDNLSSSAQHIAFMPGSITNAALCNRITAGVSHIFHLAAQVSVAESCANPEKCTDINVNGTEKLYNAARAHGVKHIIFSSSAAVYGPTNEAVSEDAPLNPISPYAESKVKGEALGTTLAQECGISVANLRYFNVHGPRQRADSPYSGVVAAFTQRLKNKEPLTIYGDGTQTRDFIPVADVVTANLHAGLCAPLRGHAINVATGTSTSLHELITQLESQVSTTAVAVHHEAPRDGDVAHSAADITRLTKLWAYRPKQ